MLSVSDIAKENETAKAIFTELAGRKVARKEIRLMRFKVDLMLQGKAINHAEFESVFKQMQEAGYGVIVGGQKPEETKFVFGYDLVNLGKHGIGMTEQPLVPLAVKPEEIEQPESTVNETPSSITSSQLLPSPVIQAPVKRKGRGKAKKNKKGFQKGQVANPYGRWGKAGKPPVALTKSGKPDKRYKTVKAAAPIAKPKPKTIIRKPKQKDLSLTRAEMLTLAKLAAKLGVSA